MDKPAILALILATLEEELAVARAGAASTIAAATDPDCKAENKYDTRSLEASYLARGQSRRVTELSEAIAAFTALAQTTPSSGPTAALGSLVTLASPDDPVAHYLIGPAGGGIEVRHAGEEILVVTPGSPLGHRLLGKNIGAGVVLQVGRAAWTVAAIS